MCAAKTYPLKHEEAHSYYNFNLALIPLQATRIHFYIYIDSIDIIIRNTFKFKYVRNEGELNAE